MGTYVQDGSKTTNITLAHSSSLQIRKKKEYIRYCTLEKFGTQEAGMRVMTTLYGNGFNRIAHCARQNSESKTWEGKIAYLPDASQEERDNVLETCRTRIRKNRAAGYIDRRRFANNRLSEHIDSVTLRSTCQALKARMYGMDNLQPKDVGLRSFADQKTIGGAGKTQWVNVVMNYVVELGVNGYFGSLEDQKDFWKNTNVFATRELDEILNYFTSGVAALNQSVTGQWHLPSLCVATFRVLWMNRRQLINVSCVINVLEQNFNTLESGQKKQDHSNHGKNQKWNDVGAYGKGGGGQGKTYPQWDNSWRQKNHTAKGNGKSGSTYGKSTKNSYGGKSTKGGKTFQGGNGKNQGKTAPKIDFKFVHALGTKYEDLYKAVQCPYGPKCMAKNSTCKFNHSECTDGLFTWNKACDTETNLRQFLSWSKMPGTLLDDIKKLDAAK